MENFDVPAYAGQKVNFTVFNVWPGDAAMSIAPLSGALDQFLKDCEVTVDPKTVERWLDPKGLFKARFNENLFDFNWETPNIRVDGKALSGSSVNRAYLYRKKTIVFLPGVFGSEIDVDVGGRSVDAFPNFLRDDPTPAVDIMFTGPVGAARTAYDAANQSVAILECDSAGMPLVEARDPSKLLHVLWIGYDTADCFQEAQRKRLGDIPPHDVLLHELRPWAYDWRLDLASTAQALMTRIKELVECTLSKRADTDDQVAVAGHSTGGVIIRYMLGLGGAEACISHAFFMNVPFRG
ncbi:MAG: hypothetical protein Q8N47_21905, partial [Bryobacterales bacterium]|nr:hypothetical protein [Bryobacterales bacterium]